MPRMLVSCIYLLLNTLCLAVLCHRRFVRVAPLFLALQTATCVQIGLRLYMASNGLDSRGDWMRLWAPGEVVLLLAAIGAALESLWKSMRKIPQSRPFIFFGLCFGIGTATSCIAMVYWSDNWYKVLLEVRAGIFLGLALLTFVGFWGALLYVQQWPRVSRMHAGLLAALFAGHVLLVDWAQWGASNLNYRIWESLCCFGWIINAQFLHREFSEVERRFADVAARLLSGHRPVPGVALRDPVPAIPADQVR